ncbi:MAG: heme o synthase [Planctomycetaceae bacterium]|nr:heme o synthase [Planctomycetaceae bacterium]
MSASATTTLCPPTMASRIRDYVAIAKPRIAIMVLLTVCVGFVLGSEGVWQPWALLHACIGVGLAATASNALNQVIERETDGRMRRTRLRPLPTGRLQSNEVLLFGLSLAVLSTVYLLLTVNALTAFLTLATIALYAGAYTPLKRQTAFCTAIGAVPGALPPVLGWAAAGAPLDLRALALFGILFVWQFPHFLAIAWIYRADYSGAGLKMLPANGRRGVVGCIAVAYALVLIPVSLLPRHLGVTGDVYVLTAILLGLMYAVAAVNFLWQENDATARKLLWASFAYLPTLLLVLTVDHVCLLQ